ncbi:hypothetical protein SAMN05216464_104161 [Mucilaginibacter pineti]|uniref:Cytochrome b561 n=2 Tax=Mucilaginibacter pineti TaxID=1391627 RepID=A0A1G7AL16_9SPHI|nr:hypothetical protein SAMN05216464_104161 [Mucilaginibacter pineti]
MNLFTVLLFFHSLIRWFVLAGLLIAICRAYRGYTKRLPFDKTDNALRHWTATVAHIQLMLGIYMYTQSPTVKSLFNGIASTNRVSEPVFFGAIHIGMMLAAIIIITIGSARARRQLNHHDKFKTMLIWFGIALAAIFIAIPWPFSPLAHRPYLRSF